MEHKKLSFETGDIHYYISKKDNLNKTILFTHGLTADYSMFAKQVEYFQNKYNIILWDMPLHGMSKNYKLFSYNSLADIIYKILTHEGIDKIILSGMSMGGYPCQYFIYKYPNMAEGFIAIDTTPLGFKYYFKLDLWFLKNAAFFANLFPEKFLKYYMAKSISKTEYAYNVMVNIYKNYTKSEMILQIDKCYKQFIEENIDISISCPFIILLGENDKTGKVASYSKQWAVDTKGKLYIIPNAAHFSNADNYMEVNMIIEQFITSL